MENLHGCIAKRRSTACLTAFLALVAAHGTCCGSATAAEPRTWIVGATVLSPERRDEGRRLNVLIEGERIAALAEALPAGARQDARVVDAAGMFLIPGLIDSHVHLVSTPGFTPAMGFTHPGLVAAYQAQLPRSYLRYGYTTVIDLNITDRALVKNFEAAPAHPDLYHCGPSLPMANGYPTQNVPPEFRFRIFTNFLYDPLQAGRMPADIDPREHTPEAAVERVGQRGGICVKTYFERGFGRDRDLPVPTLEQMVRVSRAARAAGIPVLLHATSLEAQRFGVAAGVSVFAHGLWNWGDANGSASLPGPIAELLDTIAARRIGYMPTMQVIGGLRTLFEPGGFDDPGVRRVVPKSLLAWYRSPQGRWYRDELAAGATDEQMLARYDVALGQAGRVVAYLARKDARFLFGTDTPSGPTAGNLPGLNGYLEMQHLAAARMSLRQIFEAATLNNAQAFGLDAQVGTIAAGKRANLVLLARSPLESVEAYDSIRAIWIGGRQFDPAALDAGD